MHYPLVVIGAGAGGLVLAIGYAKAGKKVLLIEKGNYGGDCTNFGCVPSKATIASAEAAHTLIRAREMGIAYEGRNFNAQNALERTRTLIQAIRHEEEPEALEMKGVETLTGTARFKDSKTLICNDQEITFDKVVIATGSHPVTPPIEGIEHLPYLTNETIFDLQEVPSHLICIGGGPIGCELAQAYRRLGAEVTLIQSAPHLLMREEPESQKLIEEVFEKEGIHLHSGCKPAKAWQTDGQVHILCACGRQTSGSHLLLAAGRAPALSSLDLDAAHVGYTPKGILVDRYGRTNQKNIWAVGDCTGQTPFTHMAEFNGRRMLWNLLVPRLFWKKWHEPDDTPRVTYTDPEIAAMGLSEAEALKKYGANKIKVYTFPFSKLDRALTTGRTEGFVKVVTKKWSSKILGATVAAPRAGEMLLELSTAMYAGLPLRKLAEIVHPYPTYAQAIRKTADLWLTETLLPELKKWTGKN